MPAPAVVARPSIDECDALLCQPGTIFEMENVDVNGQVYRTWKQQPPHWRAFIEPRMRQFANQEFVSSPLPPPAKHEDREHVSYGEMLAQSIVLGAWLRERGAGIGTRVVVGGSNSTGWLVAFIAAHLIGAVPVLLNSTLTPDAQLHCLGLTEPEFVMVDANLANVLGGIGRKALKAKNVGEVYCWSSTAHLDDKVRKEVTELVKPEASAAAIRAVEEGSGLESLNPESDAIIFFTSGTTSMPKAVLCTQRGTLSHVISASIPVARAVLRAGGDVEAARAVHNPPPEQGVALLAVPLFHCTGTLAWLVRAFLMGHKQVFMRYWSVKEAVKLMQEEQIRVIGGVPAIVTAVMQSGLLPSDYEIAGVNYGGAPPPERLAGEIAGRWPNASITHGYGMTETNGQQAAIVGQDYVDRPECVGRTQPVCDVKIVDAETRKELGPGEMGLLLARGPNLMKEYVKNAKATAEAIDADGFLNTGDMAIMDDEGWIHIRDRAKDVIIRGGENIASAEVENGVYSDKRVADCAAVPIPDKVLGELVGVAVTLAPGVTATGDEIKAAIERKLRYPARPVIVVVSEQALPRNANQKILKDQVKAFVIEAYGKRAAKAKL